MSKYPSEPLKCWDWSKELRHKFFYTVLEVKEKGGLLVAGSGATFQAFPHGFGKDVVFLPGEPYGANVAWHNDFCVRAEEACEKAGFARDLCAYMRNYWGSVLLDQFILPDGKIVKWPIPDLFFTNHFCCSHAKWYQVARELEDGQLFVGIDTGCRTAQLLEEPSINYFVDQLNEAIEKIEKFTGRKFDDELFIEAANNEISSLSLWAKVYTYNQSIPAPLDEKSMFSLYVFGILCPPLKSTVEFYRELVDEVADRVKRGIAAVPSERFRIATDAQPPWSFLSIFRHMEKYGVVSVG